MDASGVTYLNLETYLFDAFGNVIYDNIEKTLIYTVEVRYKVTEASDISQNKDKYAKAYYYFHIIPCFLICIIL